MHQTLISHPHSSKALPLRPQSLLIPVTLVTFGMVCTQIGASLAKELFPLVGAEGATALRLALAAIVLVIFFRPWRQCLDREQWRAVLLYGGVMGVMNLFFYAALATIPLGVAVALEFSGPLAVALAGSRKPLDFAWIALAVAGLALLLPLGQTAGDVSIIGILFALAAGVCWAGYIIFGQRAGTGGGPHITALGVAIAAVIALPFGAVTAGAKLLDPAILPVALGVALLSSAIPYALDMIALPRMPARIFGILMSGQPALGALAGFLILHEALNLWQLTGIVAVAIASLGATVTIARNPPPPVA